MERKEEKEGQGEGMKVELNSVKKCVCTDPPPRVSSVTKWSVTLSRRRRTSCQHRLLHTSSQLSATGRPAVNSKSYATGKKHVS
jgi:hypothetical protein